MKKKINQIIPVSVGVHDDSNDETIEAEGFSENEDEDHTDVHVFLGVSSNSSISNNTNGHSSSKGRETAARKIEIPGSWGKLVLQDLDLLECFAWTAL